MLPPQYSHTLDPFVALSFAAAATERIKLGTGVCLVVERDPIVTAKEVASLDRLSGGRFLFGVGAGWNREEMRNHGTDPSRRFKLMRERVEAMKEIWTKDEAEYHGEFVDFDPIWCWPKPVQQPHPPVLLGGSGPKVLDRVLAYADEWTPNRFGSAEELEAADRRAARARRAGTCAVVAFGVKPEPRAGRAAGVGGRRRLHLLRLARRRRGRGRAPAGRVRRAGLMGRLDELDLSLKLSKKEEAERLEAGWKRLEALRLALGAKLPGYGLGPPVLRAVRGLGRLGQGRRDQAARGAARHAPRARGPVRGADTGREAPPLPVALLAAAARAGAGWPCSTAPGTGGCWSSGWRASRREEEWRRAYGEIVELERTLAAEGMVLIKFFLHLSEEEQLKRFEERRDDPLKAWKLTPDDWENRRKRAAVRGGDRGDARAHRPRGGALGAGRGREQEVRAREGGGDGDRAHRGGDARAGIEPPAAGR